jgi:anti-sigma28 factor (negative regulator of flagellin synthesis)
MRIENAINEIRGSQKTELRSRSMEKKQASARVGDKFELSSSGEALSTNKGADTREARVEQAKLRAASGYYDQPEIRKAIADAMLDQGVVDPVMEEILSIRQTVKNMANVPDQRDDKVAMASERAEKGFYDLPIIRGQIAGKALEGLVG